MAVLTREQILGADDIQVKEVAVPEWGGEVIVKTLSGAERDSYEASLVNIDKRGKNFEMNMENAKAKLIAKAIVGEDKKPVFTEADIEALGAKSASALNRVYEAVQELSGFRSEEIEDLVKN